MYDARHAAIAAAFTSDGPTDASVSNLTPSARSAPAAGAARGVARDGSAPTARASRKGPIRTRNGALGIAAGNVDAVVSNASEERGSSGLLRADARCVKGWSSRSNAGCDAAPVSGGARDVVPEKGEPDFVCGDEVDGEPRGRGDPGGDPRGCARGESATERNEGDAGEAATRKQRAAGAVGRIALML